MADILENQLQAVVDQWSKNMQAERSKTQMTLGRFIDELEGLVEDDPDRTITGFGRDWNEAAARSYRGYYSDLAFAPSDEKTRIVDFLPGVRALMGATMEGYKGGEYMMGDRTPLWMSEWGETSGQRIMSLDTSLYVVRPVLEREDD